MHGNAAREILISSFLGVDKNCKIEEIKGFLFALMTHVSTTIHVGDNKQNVDSFIQSKHEKFNFL